MESFLHSLGTDVKLREDGKYATFCTNLTCVSKTIGGKSLLAGKTVSTHWFSHSREGRENGSKMLWSFTQAGSLWTGRQLHTQPWIKTPSRLHRWTASDLGYWSLLFRVFGFSSEVKWETTLIGLCKVDWSQCWETWAGQRYTFQRKMTDVTTIISLLLYGTPQERTN